MNIFRGMHSNLPNRYALMLAILLTLAVLPFGITHAQNKSKAPNQQAMKSDTNNTSPTTIINNIPPTPQPKVGLTSKDWLQPVATVISAFAVLLAALITLLWQNRHREMLERHFTKQQETDKATFKEQQSNDNVKFERQAQDTQFKEIQDRFASINSSQKAYAVIQLAEISEHEVVGEHESSTKEKYAFFPRTVTQMSAALHLEPDQEVRDEVKKALGRMTEFAHRTDPELVNLLVKELADANRSAKKTFVSCLAEYCCLFEGVTAQELFQKIGFIRFCENSQVHSSISSLWSLAISEECQNEITRRRDIRELQGLSPADTPDDRITAEIQNRAAQLTDCRDTLAHALRALTAAPLPTLSDIVGWERPSHLWLQNCFLACADLNNAKLQVAYLREASLQGANLSGAILDYADLVEAHMEEARLTRTQLQKANLGHAHLTDAQMLWADLRQANLRSSNLRGANLMYAKLDSAQIYGAAVKEKGIYRDANFHKTNWQNADFVDPATKNRDSDLENWLRGKFSSEHSEPDANTSS